jgi:hypothetical protein
MLERCTAETKEAVNQFTTTFTGEDGGIGFVKLCSLIETLDIQAEAGDKAAAQIIDRIQGVARFIKFAITAPQNDNPFGRNKFVRHAKRGVGYISSTSGYGEGNILCYFGGGCGGAKDYSVKMADCKPISYAEFLASARRKGHTQLISQAPKS